MSVASYLSEVGAKDVNCIHNFCCSEMKVVGSGALDGGAGCGGGAWNLWGGVEWLIRLPFGGALLAYKTHTYLHT